MNLVKKTLTYSALFCVVLLMSCGEDDPVLPAINEPTTYVFKRDGTSTVSFGGQTTRIGMAEEIISALKSSTFVGDSEAKTKIKSMFNHQEGASDFSEASLNSSDKSVKSKTAASEDFFTSNTTAASAVKADFELWIDDQVDNVFPNWETDASKGVAGVIQEAGGGSKRYVNENGLEYNQAFAKSLIGALMTDQALNNYLGTAVLDAGSNRENNTAGTVADGKSYTTMEHKWDEAYGYLFGAAPDAANPLTNIGTGANQKGDDSFLSKYLDRVNDDDDFNGIAQEIYAAFKLGRAAIVAGDYTVRDAQAAIIRQKVSEVIAVRAVYYLQQGKAGLEASNPDMAAVFHDLSEGFGFVYSLQFTRKPTSTEAFFTRSEVEGFINTIYPEESGSNGFWDVTPANLQSVSESIAAEFSFTVDQAAN